MTDLEMTRLLQNIHNLALIGYPYPQGSANDDRLVWTLGQVAGVVVRGLNAVKNDEKIEMGDPNQIPPEQRSH